VHFCSQLDVTAGWRYCVRCGYRFVHVLFFCVKSHTTSWITSVKNKHDERVNLVKGRPVNKDRHSSMCTVCIYQEDRS